MAYKKVILTSNKKAMVDEEFFSLISNYNWYFDGRYAKTDIWENGKRKRLYMHQYILGKVDGLVTDHINGNKLDNRIDNLRLVTPQVNAINKNKLPDNNKSGFQGVHYYENRKKWVAYINIDGKRKEFKYFNTKKEAIKSRNKMEEKYFRWKVGLN